MKRAIGIDIMVSAIMSSDLYETILMGSDGDGVGTRPVVQVHLNSVIGPTDGQVVIFGIVNSLMKVQETGVVTKVDLHGQLSFDQFHAEEVLDAFIDIVGRRSGVE